MIDKTICLQGWLSGCCLALGRTDEYVLVEGMDEWYYLKLEITILQLDKTLLPQQLVHALAYWDKRVTNLGISLFCIRMLFLCVYENTGILLELAYFSTLISDVCLFVSQICSFGRNSATAQEGTVSVHSVGWDSALDNLRPRWISLLSSWQFLRVIENVKM